MGFVTQKHQETPREKTLKFASNGQEVQFLLHTVFVICSSRMSSVDCNILGLNGGDSVVFVHHISRRLFSFLCYSLTNKCTHYTL